MTLDSKAVADRLPLWSALSDLFLDTELNESDLRYVAARVLKSGFSPTSVQEILWNEVFPALADNLRIATGEWSGFDGLWLQQRIVKVMNGVERAPGGYGLITVSQARKIIAETWREVCQYLPEEYRGGEAPT